MPLQQQYSQNNEYSEDHGERVKLDQSALQRPQRGAKPFWNQTDEIDRSVDDPIVEPCAGLREQFQGPDDKKAVQLIEEKLAEG